MNQVKHAEIKQTGQSEFKANIAFEDGSHESETFGSFDLANQWVVSQEAQATDTPERPASEMTPEDAEEINSNVHLPTIPAGTSPETVVARDEATVDHSNEPGTGNREAPHLTPNKRNEPVGTNAKDPGSLTDSSSTKDSSDRTDKVAGRNSSKATA